MLAYLIHDDTDANAALAALAQKIAPRLRLAGAVQHNIGGGQDCACDMELTILGRPGTVIRISQSLGSGSQGCRLDSEALERAAGLAAGALAQGADLVIVNKFGKREAAGGGFRDLIGQALAGGIPVLTAVAPEILPAFLAFAGGLAVELTADQAAGWCLAQAQTAA